MINVAEILKQVPKGTKLWSNNFGEVKLDSVNSNGTYPIRCIDVFQTSRSFSKCGYYNELYTEYGECTLWPSKDHRTWDNEALCILGIEKKPETPFNLQPFDKVLVRDSCDEKWRAEFFSHIDDNPYLPYMCVGCLWKQCIPYNDETKHLLGTEQEPPEKYRLSL